jgi:hypothetical protein
VEQIGDGVAQVLDADEFGVDLVDGRAAALGEDLARSRHDRCDELPDVRRQGSGVDRGAVDRGAHRAAGVMREHDDQRHLEHGDRVLQARDDRLADDLTGVAHDEQVAEAEVEDDLGGESGVGAPEQRRDRVLRGSEVLAASHILVRMPGLVGDETAIAVLHLGPGGCGGEGVRHDASESARICGMSVSASSAVDAADREP